MVGAEGERPGPLGGVCPVAQPGSPDLSCQVGVVGWGAFSQVSTTSRPLAYVGPFLCPLQDICRLPQCSQALAHVRITREAHQQCGFLSHTRTDGNTVGGSQKLCFEPGHQPLKRTLSSS